MLFIFVMPVLCQVKEWLAVGKKNSNTIDMSLVLTFLSS